MCVRVHARERRAREKTTIGLFTIHVPLFSFLPSSHSLKNNPSLFKKRPVTFHKTTRHFSQNNPSLFTKQPVTFIKRHFIAMKTRVNSSVHQPRSVPNRPTFFHKKRREKSQFEGIDSFFVLIFIIFIGEYKRKCYIAPINKQSLPKRLCFSSKCSTNTREKMRIFFLSRTR